MAVHPTTGDVWLHEHGPQGGDELNLTHLSFCAHTGTHVDAPVHYLEGGAGVEQMPAEAGIGPEEAAVKAMAVMFGIHKKMLPNLQVTGGGGEFAYPVWFHGSHGHAVGDSMSSFSTGVSTMVTSVSSSMSSALAMRVR